MSWLENLYKTYENCADHVGKVFEKQTPLLPICHTTQNAQITIYLDKDGNFRRASVIPKKDATTIIPCTEESGGRTGSRPINHPLCDKLQYIAGDYIKFGGTVTSGFASSPGEPHENYLKDLTNWCASPYKHPKINAILAYAQKRTVIEDLCKEGILTLDVSTGKLLKEWNHEKSEAPQIFNVLSPGNSPEDAFVRWDVEINDNWTELWKDITVWASWSQYYCSILSITGLCFITGKETTLAKNHPAKLRHAADKAKLISSNDNSGFTYRGRFEEATQAQGIGFEISQKAHNTLRWLISRQGYKQGDQVIISWSVQGETIPDLFADSWNLLGLSEKESSNDHDADQAFALRLNQKIKGYKVQLGEASSIIILGIDSATDGRMSINYYRTLSSSEFLARLEAWHQDCCWMQDTEGHSFLGAPSPETIATVAYGVRMDKKLLNAAIRQLLPCIIDGAPLPRHLVDCAIRQACKRTSKQTDSKDNFWKKSLGVACALYRKQNQQKRNYQMVLETELRSRDYLFGRLLALAERLEAVALNNSNEKRETNAARLMQRFADRPFETWMIIEKSLQPYASRLCSKGYGGFLNNIQREIDEVMSLFNREDFVSQAKLTGEFLLGFHCQRESLSNSLKQEKNEKQNQE